MNRSVVRAGMCTTLLLSFALADSQQKASKSMTPGAQSPLAPFTHFSATLSGGLLKDEPRKIYRSGDLLRVDLDNKFHVTDLIRNKTWAVHPDRCTQVGSPDVHSYPFSILNTYKVERTPTPEEETFDGHSCKIEKATFTATDDRPPVKMKLWEAEDLKGFPVKMGIMTKTRTITITYSDVKLDPPDASLFKLPAKCPEFRGNIKVGGRSPTKPKGSNPPKKP